MAVTSIPELALNTGRAIPQLGFGVFRVPPERTEAVVAAALEAGYRHIDTATLYGNEKEVGAAVAASGIAREELFVTTKLWPSDFGREAAVRGFEESLERLGLGYLDLYLLHWPAPARDLYVETWEVLLGLQRDGRIRSAGVSNFAPEHLDRLEVVPAVNQIELHPYLQQARLREDHRERGIVTEAWSPLAQGAVLDDPVLNEIAARHGVDAGRVALAWNVRSGTSC